MKGKGDKMPKQTPDGASRICVRCNFFMVEGSSIVPSKDDSKYCVACYCIVSAQQPVDPSSGPVSYRRFHSYDRIDGSYPS